MSQTAPRIEAALHRDIHPIVRVSTEFFLRSFDLLGQLHDDVVSELIVMALWHDRPLRPGRLTKEQTIIGIAGIGLLLRGYRALREFANGDFIKGLVFTAIWTANVKHVTNTPTAGDRGILKDSQRLPVSVLAISNALRLPYETVRRHADALLKDGLCTRVGRRGLVVLARTHRRNVATARTGYRIMTAFLAELRKAGITV